MSVIDYVDRDYGFVLLTIIYLNVTLVYLSMQVGKMRKKCDVKYPTMYSDKDNLFNCYQRAHQNTLEYVPSFLSLFVPVALIYPKLGSLLGAIWVTARYSYAWGYYTGDPKKRMNGAYGYIGYLGLVAMLLYITAAVFGLVPLF